MTLETFSPMPITSPLPQAVNALSPQEQARKARAGVGLVEMRDWQQLHLRSTDAGSLVSRIYDTTAPGVGGVMLVADGVLVRLRRDECLLFCADVRAAQARFTPSGGELLVTLTDLTHGRFTMRVVGPRAADALSKVCGLDFADAKFPDQYAAQTSLAKVRTLIVRLDTAQAPVYMLSTERSLAAYVWEVVRDAAQEFGGVILDQNGFDLLRN